MNQFTKFFVLTLTAATLIFQAGSSKADEKQMQQLVPDVQYQRKTDRTHVFSRAEFTYSPGNNDYLHHWVDQPLLVDPRLDKDKAPGALMSLASYELMQKTALKYGLDGFVFFPEMTRRLPFYDYTKQSGLQGFQLLTEFVVGAQAATKSDALKMALANPASFRIDGKVVVTSYMADTKSPEYWQGEIAKLKAQYGDTFIFLPDILFFDGKSPGYWQTKYHTNTVTSKDVAGIKEYLRKWLRVTDGLYTAYVSGFQTQDRIFDDDFYRNFIIRLMKSVLAEPEFQQKYFGLSAVVGHENCTRFGYTLSSDATKTLRNSMEDAMSARPDLINIPEWDEQNENTSLRPTVYNGYSTLRIMRYYTAKLRGEKLTPFPGDDTGIPNLILSYRKLLTLGEKLQIELLNVPDSDKSTSYSARLILEDTNGKVVYTSTPQIFNSAQMQDHTIVIPSESLAQYQVLRPKLEIEYNGHKSTFEDGLHYIEMHSTWNWDYKWVMQPLRDLLKPQKEQFNIGAADAEGIRIASASFTANEPLEYVEVLDNDDVVYSYSAADNWRENANQVIIRLSWEAFGGRSTGLKLSGTVALQNATARWLIPDSYAPVLKGQTLSFDGQSASMWRNRIMLAIPRPEIDKAVFKIDMPGIYQGTVALKDLMKNSVYGIPGPKGFNLVISRYLNQDRMPLNVNKNRVQFDVPILPYSKNSVFHLQAIGKSGRVYRGKPAVFQSTETAKVLITVYSDTVQHPVDLVAGVSRVPDIRYQFDSTRGSALATNAGRPFWGILGGYFAQVTGRGGGSSNDDSPFIIGRGFPKDGIKTAPDWVKTEDGKYALRFNGKSTFISLPQGVIPSRAGFTIEMDIKPDSTTGTQLIIANRSYYMGSLSIYTEEGTLKADFSGQYSGNQTGLNSGLVLPAGKWSHLTIRYDQKNLLLLVDGKPGKLIPVNGPGVYRTASVVGGYGEDWFAGEIKSLRIRHTLQENR